MKFGIMEMQLPLLAAIVSSPQRAVELASCFDHEILIDPLTESGFTTIELGGDLTLFFPSAFAPTQVKNLAKLKQTRNLSYTLHLPLWSVETSTMQEPVRKGSTEAVIQTINATKDIAPEVYVLHATGALAAEFSSMPLPDAIRLMVLKQFEEMAMRSIRDVLSQTQIPSRSLAIETIEFPWELTLEIADTLNLSICLDTGHVLAGFPGYHSLTDIITQAGSRIASVHLHDSAQRKPGEPPRYGEDHQPLGSKDLNIPELFNELNRINFSGPIIMELTLEQARASINFLRNNYSSLFGIN